MITIDDIKKDAQTIIDLINEFCDFVKTEVIEKDWDAKK